MRVVIYVRSRLYFPSTYRTRSPEHFSRILFNNEAREFRCHAMIWSKFFVDQPDRPGLVTSGAQVNMGVCWRRIIFVN